MRETREQEFWDEHVPDLDHCLRDYSRLQTEPLDGNFKVMIDAVSPLRDKRVLDFACGQGVVSAWIAAQGADVTGLDVSPLSIERAQSVAEHVGVSLKFTTDPLEELEADSFDAVVGHYALHHVDLHSVGPQLRRVLRPGGRGAFVETLGLNPVLNVARSRVSGRGPVARYGSDDERPLTNDDLGVLRRSFAEVTLVAGQVDFLRVFDRNVLRYRNRRISRALAGADDVIGRVGLGRLSYHQVVVLA